MAKRGRPRARKEGLSYASLVMERDGALLRFIDSAVLKDRNRVGALARAKDAAAETFHQSRRNIERRYARANVMQPKFSEVLEMGRGALRHFEQMDAELLEISREFTEDELQSLGEEAEFPIVLKLARERAELRAFRLGVMRKKTPSKKTTRK